jgi:hypothetical protein
VNFIRTGDGSFVIPGCCVVTPVGAAGVPPHVHVVLARAAGTARATANAMAIAGAMTLVLMTGIVHLAHAHGDGASPEIRPEPQP